MTTTHGSDLSDQDVEVLLAELPVAGHDELLGALLTLRADPAWAPVPSADLGRLLQLGCAPPRRRAVPAGLAGLARSVQSRWRRGVVGLAAVMIALFGAATANALPGPVQSAVAAAVAAVTPFQLPVPDLPESGRKEPGGPAPTDEVTVPTVPAGAGPAEEPTPGDVADTGADSLRGGQAGPEQTGGDPSRSTAEQSDRDRFDTGEPAGSQTAEPDRDADVEGDDSHSDDAEEHFSGTAPSDAADRPLDENSGSQQPDSEQPDSEQPDSDEPGSGGPDNEEPDGGEPDGDEPDGDEPDGDGPDSDEPDGDGPDSDRPDRTATGVED